MPVNVTMDLGPEQPDRWTRAFPMFYSVFGGIRRNDKRAIPKPSPYNLRKFAEQPVCRAAINRIKDPICGLHWRIVPVEGLEMTPDMEDRARKVANCLRRPNASDTFRSFLEALVDDTLTVAGAAEMQATPDQPEHPGWMFLVDGATIRMFPNWNGDPNEARYAQYDQYDQQTENGILLRNDQLMYIRMNPRTSTPFGLTPVEVAYTLVNSFMAAFNYAEKLAGDMTPPGIIDLGPDATPEDVAMMRIAWTDSVEGQGQMPIVGGYAAEVNADGTGGQAMKYIPLAKGDDSDLRISWQMWIVRLIALAFGLAPQSLNLETTVNRATAEVMSEDEEVKAIKPCAHLVEEHITHNFIWGCLGDGDLRFQFMGIEPGDDQSQADIWETLDSFDSIVPDEVRKKLGAPDLPNGWGKLTRSQRQIRVAQAQGTKVEIQDPAKQSEQQAPALKGSLEAVAELFAAALQASDRRPATHEAAQFNEALGKLVTVLDELLAS